MGDDLQANVSMYKLQLQQDPKEAGLDDEEAKLDEDEINKRIVEDSLTLDPENEDLLKLKTDLQEVIQLTSDLIGQKQSPDEIAAGQDNASGHDATATKRVATQHWQPGDKCLAIWSEDKGYYEATVEEVLEDGACTVTFEEYGNTEVTEVSLLKPLEVDSGKKKALDGAAGSADQKKPLSKKDKQALEREYKRKKSQKKAQRRKDLEEERETEKNKWIDFNSKTFSKTNKGKVKKSIFATPDTVEGKVGVGTCGHSGKPMTKFTHQDKWRK